MCIRKWGDTLQISKVACFSILPLFFLISSILFCSTTSNKLRFTYRRKSRRSICFKYDEGREIWCENFSIFIKTSLSQVNPPALVKFFLYTHPPILKEFIRLNNMRNKAKRSSMIATFFIG